VERPDLAQFPLFRRASPVSVDVCAGETLYIPALWYHAVSHPTADEEPAIAVNTWRDMTYLSGAFATYSLLREAALLTTRSRLGGEGAPGEGGALTTS